MDVRIGILSDTHDVLPPRVLELFQGVEHILHGGDVGRPWVLLELEQIAPVTAVLGNTDVGLHYRETELVILGGRRFLLHHIVEPRRLTEPLRRRIHRDRPDVVVFGHTHTRFCETIDGILYLNPGSAGRSRMGDSRSVATLSISGPDLDARFHDLD